MKPFFFLAAIVLLPVIAAAQQAATHKPDYPQDYFRNPLDIPIFLAGNFGECRPGHFHSGADIKTQGVENKAVHAAAGGYVSRIKMESGGFGHGLYITHPNGYTTLYAHLNKFSPAIQEYVEAQQYSQKKWNVDLQLSPARFPVQKGDQVAWSGNTGGSSAPHLHFEIRNTKTEHPLNPELFGLPVTDHKPPVPAEVTFYLDNTTGHGSFYENDKVTVATEKKGGLYKLAKPAGSALCRLKGDTLLLPRGNTGIGINVDDYMDGSDNTISFYTARLYLDDSLQAEVTLDDIGYDESRYINAYTDYKIRQQQHKWVQLLFQLPGNRLDGIYTYLNGNRGKLRRDTAQHKVTILITDDRDNASTIQFYLGSMSTPTAPPAYEGLPGTPFYANRLNVYNEQGISFQLDNRQLYDDINFVLRRKTDSSTAWSDRYQLHEAYVPLHHYFDLQIIPRKPIPASLTGKVVIMYYDGKDTDGRAAIQGDNGGYKAKVRNFGCYWLDTDTVPPVIKPQQVTTNMAKARQIALEVTDDKTSIRSFSGYIDGKWVCFEQHSNKYFYNFDSHCPRGKHQLVFKAEDENGNMAQYELSFTR